MRRDVSTIQPIELASHVEIGMLHMKPYTTRIMVEIRAILITRFE